MIEEEPLMIDVNTADTQTLTQLPGVGPAMAERIVAARPFASVDDLQRVSGVGPGFLERLRSRITVSEIAETGKEEEAEAISLETETRSEAEDILLPEVEPWPEVEALPPVAEIRPEEVAPPEEEPAPRREPALVTRAQALWMAFSAGLLALALAVALILGLLNAINGGLQFATPAQVADMSRQMEGVNRQAAVLEQDLEGVRTRLDNLERLSGRLEAVEETSVQLQADVEELGTQADALEKRMDDLDQRMDDLDQEMDDLVTQVETLQGQTSRFQGFLDGLRTLLGDLLESEETK
jgi:competence ComEA-like helix-hairpin-helix protein